MTTAVASLTELACACGYAPPIDDPRPFRCPNAGKGDVDHLLRRTFHAGRPISGSSAVNEPVDSAAGRTSALPLSAAGEEVLAELRAPFTSHQRNPFIRFRHLLHSWNAAMANGHGDHEFVDVVDTLQRRIEHIDGSGFEVTPLERQDRLCHALHLPGTLWVKDETLNVSGSHKGRHLMGLMIWLEMMSRGDRSLMNAPLAIASCGNAALAAAVIARAAGRSLQVFIPPDANTHVVSQLETLGASITSCPRTKGVAGDPAFHAFRRAVAAGALPFTCQGTENGLAIEGGQTIGWEMVSQFLAAAETVDHFVIQVGGGALASACIAALEDGLALGLLTRLPKIHAVQTEVAHPLCRAYQRLSGAVRSKGLETALRHAETHRSEFMWPWEAVPQSIATGILDDETYDWFAVARGMLISGGSPVIVSEALLAEANQAAVRHTGIPVDATGSAGLAGVIELTARGAIAANESVAVLFTGRQR